MSVEILCAALPRDTKAWQLEELLLPHQNINAQLSQWLKTEPCIAEGVYVGLFAADPFVAWSELRDLLQLRGVRALCNFPPVGGFSHEFCQLLDTTGHGVACEQSRLAWLAEQGFDVLWIAARDHNWQLDVPQPPTLRLSTSAKDAELLDSVFSKEQVRGV